MGLNIVMNSFGVIKSIMVLLILFQYYYSQIVYSKNQSSLKGNILLKITFVIFLLKIPGFDAQYTLRGDDDRVMFLGVNLLYVMCNFFIFLFFKRYCFSIRLKIFIATVIFIDSLILYLNVYTEEYLTFYIQFFINVLLILFHIFNLRSMNKDIKHKD